MALTAHANVNMCNVSLRIPSTSITVTFHSLTIISRNIEILPLWITLRVKPEYYSFI